MSETTRAGLAGVLAEHRQQHNPSTGASDCACDGWTGPYTMHVTDGRGYHDHLAAAVRDHLAAMAADDGVRRKVRNAVERAQYSSRPDAPSLAAVAAFIAAVEEGIS